MPGAPQIPAPMSTSWSLLSAIQPPRTHGRTNITQYRPRHLLAMARRGSLFVLHLRLEGYVISDPVGLLERCLVAYQQPPTYDQLKVQLGIAAGALDISSVDCADFATALSRLGIYLLRTAVYIRCVEIGEPTFDLHQVSALLRDADLDRALALRRATSFHIDHVAALHAVIRRYLPDASFNPYGSVQAYAVATARHPFVSALLTAVLCGSASIEYNALALPPYEH